MPPANASDDYFGFSVALHQIRVPTSFDEALTSTRILVGAPKGTYPGGLLDLPMSSTPESETGLVYDCPVQQGTCGMIGNGQGNDARLFDPDPNTVIPNNINRSVSMFNVNELKSGQQMGATLISSGELFVACAPQFIISFQEQDSRDFDRRRKIGRCFYSQRNLTGFRELRPCTPTVTISGGGSNRCVSGTSIAINQNNGQSFIALGAPGAINYQGRGYLYTVNDGKATIPSPGPMFIHSSQLGDVYETYSMITGNITGGDTLEFITSVPRANGSDYRGLVSVRRNFYNIINLGVQIRGTQLAEYFGYSMAAADLNGDGYDEIIVGAPIYSDSERDLQEIGRVYIFRNNGGDISDTNPIVLSGDEMPRARFGSSVVNIGDVNDDGYEDFAVGAPYQELMDGNSGKVFIYYGSPDFTGSSANQTISASDVALTTRQPRLRTFGWSLTSGVDVDKNEYLDLLVGAYESGTAVLFRTLSVARIQISASSNLANNILPIDLTGGTVSFNLRLCASFSGRGLTGSLETILNVEEVVERGGTRRLRFDGAEDYSQSFRFMAANQQECRDITVTIPDKLSLYSSGSTTVSDFQIRFNMIEAHEPRMTPPDYNGNPASLSDLTKTPILIVGGMNTFTAIPMVSCDTEFCEPNLNISVVNQGYLYWSSASGTVYPDIVAGSTGVDRISTPLRIGNIKRDAAIGATVRISIPLQFEFVESDPSNSEEISCRSIGGPMYECILPPFIGGMTSVLYNVTWQRRENIIRGTEAPFNSTIQVNAVNDTDPTNNDASINVTFGALADLEITSVLLSGPSRYNTSTPGSELMTVDQLGGRVILNIVLQNRGPSALNSTLLSSARLSIRIPTRDSTTGEFYYLYPFNTSVSGTRANVTCDSTVLNPLDLEAPPSNRAKRSFRSRRQDSAAQDSNTIPAGSSVQNCNVEDVASCRNTIDCTVTDWSPNQDISIMVISYLDRRFLSTRSNPFTFVAVADIEIMSRVTRDDDRSNNRRESNNYNIERMAQGGNNLIPIIVPIIAAIAALIIIVALFCLLFFCGFFRRKRYEKEEPEEMQVREVPPEEGEVVNGGKPGPPPTDEEVAPEREETTPTKEPLENDIGDASDLQDGEIATAEADPDETSL